MGVDTIFYNGEIIFDSDSVDPIPIDKITRKYIKMNKTYQKSIGVDTKDWAFSDDDDYLLLTVNSRAHRGSAHDFIPNLLLALDTAKGFGFTPVATSISYSTSWGDALGGVLRVGSDMSITLTEVDGSTGRVARWTYTLDDVKKIKNGTFKPESGEVILIEGEF